MAVNKTETRPPDRGLLLVTLALVVIGVLLVFDSSFPVAGDKAIGDAWYFVKRQIAYAIVGVSMLFAAMKCSPKFFRKLTWFMVAAAVVSLVLVLMFGHSIGGASRSFNLKFIHVQPSEFAKIAVIMLLAHMLQRIGVKVRKVVYIIVPIALVGVISLLVLMEPDLGTASTIVFISAAMFYAAGAKKRHLLVFGAFGFLAAGLVTCIEAYKLERIYIWYNPWADPIDSGYQIIHALTALGTGGFLGSGLCEGIEKSYIPAPQTDMIGATLGEEAGFIGMLILLALFVVFVYRGLSIADRAKSRYAGLLTVGVTTMVGAQAFINIGVLCKLLPMTGVPLPFISYGGSHMIAMLFAVGMVLSVSRHIDDRLGEKDSSADESSGYRRRDGGAHLSRISYSECSVGNRRGYPVRR